MKRRKNKQRRNANKFGSLIDSLVTAISPQAGLKRKAWREYSKLTEDNIRAARKQIGDIHQKPASLRQRSWKQVDGDDSNRSHRKTTDNYEINSLLEQDLAKAQTEGIALYGENSIAHAAVEARVTYEVGDGLTAQPSHHGALQGERRLLRHGFERRRLVPLRVRRYGLALY